MGYYHPAGGKGSQKELADMYGVEGTNYGRPGMDGNSRTVNDVERDIRGAMMDDYSTREFLKYNEGVRDEANEIKNLRDQNSFIHNAMKQDHKDAGNGGKYSSDGDRGGVGMRAFNTYEDNERERVNKLVAGLENKVMQEDDDSSPTNKSPNMSFNEYMENNPNPGQYTASSETASGAKAQEIATATINKIKGDKGLIEKGKAKQGMFALNNLGSKEFQSNQESF